MPRPDNSKQKWIEKGYEHFALYGPDNISINAISKEIGSPRASFYHHFSDMEVFINLLLETNLDVNKIFIEEGKECCDRLLPDYFQLLERFPMALRFQRQLFINRHIPIFGYMFSKIQSRVSKELTLDLFVREFDLNHKHEDMAELFLTLSESWYTRINPEKLDAIEMQRIAEEVMNTIIKFITSDLYAKLT